MSLDGMTAYYAQRAAEYEQIYQKPERQTDLAALRELISQELIDRDVLEIACGTGYWTEVIAATAHSILALDINEEVLEVARRKPLAGTRAFFDRADVYALPEFPRKFDAALAAFWWSHVPRPKLREFLQQFHRRLTPDAKVVFLDNHYVEGSSTPVSRRDAEGNTFQQRCLQDGSTHEVLKNFPSEAELRETMDGLASNLQIRWLKYYWILAYTPASP